MFEDISNAIKATLYERVSSPFISSFVLSWCVFNYKILFILFSNMDTRYKFYEIEVLQLQPQKILGFDFSFYPYVFLFPFLTAIFYTLVFPFIEIGLTYVWMKGQKLVKSTKVTIEDETPISQEKYTALLKKIRQMDRDYGDDLERKDNECKVEMDLAAHKLTQLDNEFKKLESEYSSLGNNLNQVLEREKKLQHRHDSLLKDNDDASKTIAKLKQNLEDLYAEINSLKEKLEEKSNKITHLETTLKENNNLIGEKTLSGIVQGQRLNNDSVSKVYISKRKPNSSIIFKKNGRQN
ncbi:hypothetical protein HG547_19855 [Shewanella sp. DNRA4]|uniref:hypothetical protein n=1 Tax=Shewanella sp. DNRA4 TaxID=2723055 RepID=UPI00146DA884|nr:hypothetical protein [Shewanella sp. DNRA4]NMD53860.1 hypothetical protein [Shewanella sp. DNRA4]